MSQSAPVKIVFLLEKRKELDDSQFSSHWTDVHAPLAAKMPGLLDYTVNLPSALQRGSRPVDGYAVLRFESLAAGDAAFQSPEGIATTSDTKLFASSSRRLIVEEHPVVIGTAPVKLIYLVKKRPDLDDAQFVAHWTEVHAALAANMPGLRAYTVNLPSALQQVPRPADGYAMLRFDTYEQARSAWQSPEGMATAEDAKLFLAEARALIVDEHPVVGHR